MMESVNCTLNNREATATMTRCFDFDGRYGGRNKLVFVDLNILLQE